MNIPAQFMNLTLRQLKYGVWCAVSARRIIAPVFKNKEVYVH